MTTHPHRQRHSVIGALLLLLALAVAVAVGVASSPSSAEPARGPSADQRAPERSIPALRGSAPASTEGRTRLRALERADVDSATLKKAKEVGVATPAGPATVAAYTTGKQESLICFVQPAGSGGCRVLDDNGLQRPFGGVTKTEDGFDLSFLLPASTVSVLSTGPTGSVELGIADGVASGEGLPGQVETLKWTDEQGRTSEMPLVSIPGP